MSVSLARKVRYIRLFFGLLCLSGLVFSPYPESLQREAASAPQSERPFSLRVEVELVTAEVIVLDKKGAPIQGLKKEDFRLYEDGKQQEIASFDEVREEPGQTPTADFAGANRDILKGKTVLILFDDSTIAPTHLKSTRDSAEVFVKRHMRSQDLFAVASYNLSLRILQNFTDDPLKVLAAIRQPAVAGGQSPNAAERSPLSARGNSNVIPSVSPEARYKVESFLRTLDSLSQSVDRVRGRKSVLLFSEDMDLGEESRYLYLRTVQSARKANAVFYTIDAKGLDLNPFGEVRPPRKQAKPYDTAKTTPRESASVKSIFTPLTSALSMQGFGIRNYARNAMFQQGGGGTGGGGTGGGGTGGGGSGGSGGGTGSGGSGGGSTGGTGRGGTGGGPFGGTGSGSTGISGPGTNTTPGYNTGSSDMSRSTETSRMNFSSLRVEENVLRSLAYETGGTAVFNTHDFNEELDKLDRQLSNYYILGFQSGNPKRDGSFRKIEVKTDLKGTNLIYRKGYVDRRPLDTLVSSKQEKSLLKAMASATPAAQLPITFRANYFYDSPRMARAVVSARISLEKAEFKKRGGQSSCDLNVMGAAYAENDMVSARFSETVPVTIDKEKEQSYPKNLAYTNYFKLRPGKYRLKLAASDGANNLGSMEQPLEIPVFPENGIAGSSLVVAERLSQLPPLIENLQARMLDDSNPLICGGLQLAPSVDNILAIHTPVMLMYKIYNIAGNLEQWKAQAKIRFLRDTGEEVASLPTLILEQDLSQSDNSEATIGFSLPLQGIVIPGKYQLVIETTEASSSRTARVQADLELTKN